MPKNLNEARRSLERAKESAQKRLLELENERRDIKASVKSLDAALRALSRSDQRQSTDSVNTDASTSANRQQDSQD